MTVASDFYAVIEALRDQPLIVLAEMQFAYESGGAPATGTVYLADGIYATKAGETPPSISYIDAIESVPSFSRQIDQRQFMGGATYSIGSMELTNADGRLDFMLDLVCDGWPCEFYLGRPNWMRSQFIKLVSAITERVAAPSPDRITVTLRDPGYLLDKRISGTAIGGSTSNANRNKPLAIGCPQQVEGLLGDTTNLRFWLGAVNHPNDVRDNGVTIKTGYAAPSGTTAAFSADAGTDTITYTAHGLLNEQVVTVTTTGTVFAGMTIGAQYWVRNRAADTFQLSETRTGAILNITGTTFTGTMTLTGRGYYLNGDGSIDVSATPAGRITADLTEPAGASSYAEWAAIEAVVLTHAALHPSRWGGYHPSYSIASNVGVGYLVTDPDNVVDVLDALTMSNGLWWGFSRLGVFHYGAIWGTADSSQLTLYADDITPRGEISIDRLPVTYNVTRILYNKNWTEQTDLAASVSAANRALWSGPGYYYSTAAESGTAYSSAPSLYHKTMASSRVIESAIAGYALPLDDAGDAVTRIRSLTVPFIDIIRVSSDLRWLGLELGDEVTLADFPLIEASYPARVIGVDVDMTKMTVTLTLYRSRPPDTYTSAYYG